MTINFMIYGIGTDIVTVSRIGKMCKTYGANAVADKILSRIEYLEWPSASNPVLFLAKRFAAKEAFAKAVGTGLRSPVLLSHLAVVHDDLGRPQWVFAEPLAAWLAERDIHRCHLSISDERAYCVAFVVLETD